MRATGRETKFDGLHLRFTPPGAERMRERKRGELDPKTMQRLDRRSEGRRERVSECSFDMVDFAGERRGLEAFLSLTFFELMRDALSFYRRPVGRRMRGNCGGNRVLGTQEDREGEGRTCDHSGPTLSTRIP